MRTRGKTRGGGILRKRRRRTGGEGENGEGVPCFRQQALLFYKKKSLLLPLNP